MYEISDVFVHPGIINIAWVLVDLSIQCHLWPVSTTDGIKLVLPSFGDLL